ncbi:MAG: flippase [Terriglobales bacterium]|jgi:O-antigen/teichoic acid export membrane protein
MPGTVDSIRLTKGLPGSVPRQNSSQKIKMTWDRSKPTGDGSNASNHARVGVFKNYSFLAASYAASRLLTFGSLIYIARHLGVAAFGQINFALAIFTYWTLLTHLGLMTFGTREVARRPGEIQGKVAGILSLRLALTLVSFVLLVLLIRFTTLDGQLKILILLFGLSLFPTAALLDWAFKGMERMNVVGLIELVRSVPYLVLVLFWVKQPSQVLRIPVFFFFSTVLAAGLGWDVFRRDYGWPVPRVRLVFWKRAMRESLPLGFAFMLLQVYYLTDIVVLGFLRGAVSVGYYSAAYKSVAFVLMLGGLFFETTFPVIARHYQQDRGKLPGLIRSSLRLTLFLAIPMAAGGTVLAGPILTSLYGAEYRSATLAFQLLIWAVAIEIIGLNWGYALMACDQSRAYMKAVGVGAVLSVGLNLALIPKLGLMGAGLARLASSALISLGLWFQFRRISPLRWAQYLFKPALASAIMVAVMVFMGPAGMLGMTHGMTLGRTPGTIWGTTWGTILGTICGTLIYGVTMLLIGPSERAHALRLAHAMWAPSRLAPSRTMVFPVPFSAPECVPGGEEPRAQETGE